MNNVTSGLPSVQSTSALLNLNTPSPKVEASNQSHNRVIQDKITLSSEAREGSSVETTEKNAGRAEASESTYSPSSIR